MINTKHGIRCNFRIPTDDDISSQFIREQFTNVQTMRPNWPAPANLWAHILKGNFWATVVCPVCNVGVLWPNSWMYQGDTWYGDRPRPRRCCVRWGPSSLPHGKGNISPHFSIVAKRSPISATAKLLFWFLWTFFVQDNHRRTSLNSGKSKREAAPDPEVGWCPVTRETG